MAIEDRDTFLVRAEMQHRRHEAAQERLARAARREAAAQQRAAREDATRTAHQDAPNDTPGLFGWLRRLAG
jgi:hypothetical protein